MAAWRMARGWYDPADGTLLDPPREMWLRCRELGVAAITYDDVQDDDGDGEGRDDLQDDADGSFAHGADEGPHDHDDVVHAERNAVHDDVRRHADDDDVLLISSARATRCRR